MPIPDEVAPLLEVLPEALADLLGPDLVGVYIYGSLLEADFDPARSDVDCIVVTERALSDAECDRLDAWLSGRAMADPWVGRLQMSFLTEGSLLAEERQACLYHFGELERGGSDGNPLIWMDFFQRGCTLHGAAPESFLPAITADLFRQALIREIGYLREEMCTKPDSQWRDVLSYRTYAVLTLCRILYSADTGAIVSKTRAGAWALDRVPTEWQDLIRRALSGEAGGRLADFPVTVVCGFIEYTVARVRATDPVPPQVEVAGREESDPG